jgi:hypothetical protein
MLPGMCDLADVIPDGATTASDRLLVAALRCHAAGAGCDLVAFFDLVFGPRAAAPVARALAGFARALLARGRRPPRLGRPGQPPTPDEIAAVRLIAALRAHDHEAAAGRLLWLAPRATRGRLLGAALSLANLLAGHGLAVAAE